MFIRIRISTKLQELLIVRSMEGITSNINATTAAMWLLTTVEELTIIVCSVTIGKVLKELNARM